jgi:hypothetical protein
MIRRILQKGLSRNAAFGRNQTLSRALSETSSTKTTTKLATAFTSSTGAPKMRAKKQEIAAW